MSAPVETSLPVVGGTTGPRAPRSTDAVYVHAPFCARRCVYCDFAVKVRSSGGAEEWIEAVRAELAFVRREGLFELADVLSSLYVGGGTPSLLGPAAMSGLRDLVGAERLGGSDLEWTAEANPESFTPDLAGAWGRAGVNRISLGIQSFHEETLRWMGRLHGPEGALEAVRTARAAGLENLSVDLIFALPAHLRRSWTDDLDRVIDLDVPHVSLYGLGVEPATALGRAVSAGREPPVDDERYADEFLMAAERLTAAGYEHYEVSNFARPGMRARHNGVYWTGAPYLGLGNGAHSYAPPIRRWNVRDWDEYAARAVSGHGAEEGRESIEGETLELERVWLGLRTREGIERPDTGTPRGRLVEKWVAEKWAQVEGDRVRLTAEGWLLLDRLAVDYVG